VVSIEASTNLMDWQIVVTTNSPGGMINYTDQGSATYPKRFFRTRQ
jgi:hypothetical protein